MMPLSLPDWFLFFLIANLSMVFAATLYYSVRWYRRMPRRRAVHFPVRGLRPRVSGPPERADGRMRKMRQYEREREEFLKRIQKSGFRMKPLNREPLNR